MCKSATFFLNVFLIRNYSFEFLIAKDKFVENFNLPCFEFLLTSSSSPGSQIGIIPRLSLSIFFLSISVQITLFPNSAKQGLQGQFDLTWYVIVALKKLGLARDIRLPI